MVELKRTNSEDKDFQYLVSELDKDLAIRNGETNEIFVQYNKTDQIKNALVAFIASTPVGCGAMKKYDPNTMEIKRMYVALHLRGKGIAAAILQDLEKWAKELGYSKCVIETGDQMPEAIGLYKKSNYRVIPNYGPYRHIECSICFEKNI